MLWVGWDENQKWEKDGMAMDESGRWSRLLNLRIQSGVCNLSLQSGVCSSFFIIVLNRSASDGLSTLWKVVLLSLSFNTTTKLCQQHTLSPFLFSSFFTFSSHDSLLSRAQIRGYDCFPTNDDPRLWRIQTLPVAPTARRDKLTTQISIVNGRNRKCRLIIRQKVFQGSGAGSFRPGEPPRYPKEAPKALYTSPLHSCFLLLSLSLPSPNACFRFLFFAFRLQSLSCAAHGQ
ncbi:uncharacterized protein BJX67DRAFT_212204 [Aspergillus lucknowensis]|uniref:Uncharacterized protein n=1 Tax=Aspergillus lucknowensis TaxID=176173 RepID=A0ABR4M2E7_9EURO